MITSDKLCRVQFPAGARNFFFTTGPDQLWGPLSLLSSGYGSLLHWGVTGLWHEANHSPPSMPKLHMCGAIPPLPIHFHHVVLI